MIDSVLLTLYVILTSLNLIDSVQTRVAVRKGHEEKMPILKCLIRKFGLDKGIFIKSLLVQAILAIPIPFSWINVGIGWGASILFIVVMIWYSYVVIHNFMVLWKSHH